MASNLALLLAEGEADIASGKTKPLRAFLRAFKNAHEIRVRSPKRDSGRIS